MADLFLYGSLCHRPLLDVVLGRSDVSSQPATLPGHTVTKASGQSFPFIAEGGDGAPGLLLTGLTDRDLARLEFYEGGFGYGIRILSVETPGGALGARVFWPDPGRWEAGEPWSLADWEAEWGALAVEAATEYMTYHGRLSAREAALRFPFIEARAWSRHLARTRLAPQALRSPAGSAAPEVTPRPGAYDGFFRLQPIAASHVRFDGTRGPVLEREGFIGFDAALVLPYDPARDLVLLIEQFRYGPTLRSDLCTRVLEPIAGMVDAGEEPIETARREAIEEAGLTLTDIRPMTRVYASPGYSTDFFHCFLALADLDFETGRIGGAASEHEDIRSHILPFDQAMDLVRSGEINVAPLAMMLLWLAALRDDLRA